MREGPAMGQMLLALNTLLHFSITAMRDMWCYPHFKGGKAKAKQVKIQILNQDPIATIVSVYGDSDKNTPSSPEASKSPPRLPGSRITECWSVGSPLPRVPHKKDRTAK